MAPTSEFPILRRMAGARPPGEAAADPAGEAPELVAATATAILRLAEALPGLGLSLEARSARRLPTPEALDGFAAHSLSLLIDPPDLDPAARDTMDPEALAAATGTMVLDPVLVDALVEVQTIGRADGPARPPRRPTRIDAALAQPFARALLEQAARLAPASARAPRPGTLRSGGFVAGTGPLSTMLTAALMVRVDLTLTLAEGARKAGLALLLPTVASAGELAPVEGPGGDDWVSARDEAMPAAPVRLEAVLPPLRLPLSRLLSLGEGDVLPLDPAALSQVTLHGGASGLTVPGRARLPRDAAMGARLGQLNGRRAVKLTRLPGEAAARPGKADPADGFGAANTAAVAGPMKASPAGGPPVASSRTVPASAPAAMPGTTGWSVPDAAPGPMTAGATPAGQGEAPEAKPLPMAGPGAAGSPSGPSPEAHSVPPLSGLAALPQGGGQGQS